MPRASFSLSLSVFALCLPASHWLSSSGGFLSLHLSLSLSLTLSLSVSQPPLHTALRCLLSSLFLPPTPSHCSNSLPLFPTPLPIPASSPCNSALIWEPLITLYLCNSLFSSPFLSPPPSHPHLPFVRESSWTSVINPPLANVYPRDSPCLCSHLITPSPAQPLTIKCCLGYQRGFKGVGEDGSRKGWRRNSRGAYNCDLQDQRSAAVWKEL